MASFSALQLVVYGLVALAGTAVALTRDPKRQLFIAGVYGLLLATLFFMLHAPDVSLSELGVGAIGLPAMVFFALAKLEKGK